jgi:hypothetical protein
MKWYYTALAQLLLVQFPTTGVANDVHEIKAGLLTSYKQSGASLKVNELKISTAGRSAEASDCQNKLQNFAKRSEAYLRIVIESSAGQLVRCTLHPR